MKFEPIQLNPDQSVKKSSNKNDQKKREQNFEKTLASVKEQIIKEQSPQTRFPIDAFPERIQNVLNCFYECYKLPIDYHATSTLVAASVAIGNGYAAHYKKMQVYPPILYAAIVGFPSSGKSPGIDFGIYPLQRIERKLREDHNYEMDQYIQRTITASIKGNGVEEPPRS